MMTKSALKVEIISRKTIKPSSPTPQCLITLKLSRWDEPLPPMYSFLIFFYHSNNDPNDDDDFGSGSILSSCSERSQRLQKTLSDALTHYYPLAGRLKNDFTAIECNDAGAHFVEARINCRLAEFLRQPDPEFISNQFNPTVTDPMFPSNCTLAIQLTLFTCGGLAILISPSHKISDAASLSSFVQCWTSLNREYQSGKTPKLVAPKFLDAGSSSPPGYLLGLPFVPPPPGKYITKGFVFPGSKIACLKANITGDAPAQHFITNVDAVLALIMNSAISASKSLSSSTTHSRPIVLFHVVNMRKRVVPPLPESTIGNIFWLIPVVIGEKKVMLKEIASSIRESLSEVYEGKASKIIEKGEIVRKIMVGRRSPYYQCSSLTGLPLYEADFGWGKPLWVTCPSNMKNSFFLLPTRNGDGIEAWISLDEKEMAIFENDRELLSFATINSNPSSIQCRM